MCAPIEGRSGPVGAHPRNEGALRERWRAQCGTTPSTIQQSANSRICRQIDRSLYTDVLTTAFLSLAPRRPPALTKAICVRVHDRYRLTGTAERPDCASMAMTAINVVRELQELIAALDRRVPQVQRAGEASIARDAAALKARALKRIEELEREASTRA